MGDVLTRLDDQARVQGMADGILNMDLNKRLIRKPVATFLPPAPDNGIDGIQVGDLLVVDRSLNPAPGRVIFAEIDRRYCLRRLVQRDGELFLVDDRGIVRPKRVRDQDYYHGTVTYSIHAQG